MIPHCLRFFAVSLTLFACLNGCATAPSPLPPPSPDYHLLLGELALLRDQRDIAAAEYAAAANVLNDVGVARRATLLALHAGDIASARQAVDRWEALAPDDLEAAQYQGMLHARANDTAQAVTYLLRVTDGHAPQDPAAVASNLQVLTGLLVGEPNPWRSADLMAAIAHARSANAVAWQGAALLALQADRPDQAAAFAERALVLEPGVDDVRLLHARARLLALPRPDAATVLAPLAEWEHAADPGLRARYAGRGRSPDYTGSIAKQGHILEAVAGADGFTDDDGGNETKPAIKGPKATGSILPWLRLPRPKAIGDKSSQSQIY